MIDPNILNILKSNSQAPSYSILVERFSQPEFCNKEQLQIVMHQVSPNLNDIINNKNNVIETLKGKLTENNIPIPELSELSINNIVSKTLSIDSILNYDQTGSMFTSGLTGSISAESVQNTPQQSLNGRIKNKRITFDSKDYPNVFSNNQFNVQKEKVTIDIANNIQSIEVTVSHNDLVASYNTNHILIPFNPITFNTITDNQLIINMADIRTAITPTAALNDIDDQIDALENPVEDPQMTTEQIAEAIDILNKTKQAIIDKINGLNFSLPQPFSFVIKYQYTNDITSSQIECIRCELASQIDIDFLTPFNDLPGIIITIDKDNKKYSSYDMDFKTDNSDRYSGVVITFNNLKKIREPIPINILIIGDDFV